MVTVQAGNTKKNGRWDSENNVKSKGRRDGFFSSVRKDMIKNVWKLVCELERRQSNCTRTISISTIPSINAPILRGKLAKFCSSNHVLCQKMFKFSAIDPEHCCPKIFHDKRPSSGSNYGLFLWEGWRKQAPDQGWQKVTGWWRDTVKLRKSCWES